MAELMAPLVKALALIFGVVALLVVVNFVPSVAGNITAAASAIGGIGGFVLGLVGGIILAIGVIVLVAELFGIKLGL